MKLVLRSYKKEEYSLALRVLIGLFAITAVTLTVILFVRIENDSVTLQYTSIILAVLTIALLIIATIRKKRSVLVDEGTIEFMPQEIRLLNKEAEILVKVSDIKSLTLFANSYDGQTRVSWALGGLVTKNGLGNSMILTTVSSSFKLFFILENIVQARTLSRLLASWRREYDITVRFTDRKSHDLLVAEMD